MVGKEDYKNLEIVKQRNFYSLDFGAGAVALGAGLERILSHVSECNSLREAVYSHSDMITGDVVQRANELANTTSPNLVIGYLGLLLGGLMLGNAYKNVHSQATITIPIPIKK